MKKLSDIVKLGKKDKKTGKKDKKTGHDWPEFRALSDEKLQKKLEGFPEDKMLELYKKTRKGMQLSHRSGELQAALDYKKLYVSMAC